MKKIITIILTLALCSSLCADAADKARKERKPKQKPDKVELIKKELRKGEEHERLLFGHGGRARPRDLDCVF